MAMSSSLSFGPVSGGLGDLRFLSQVASVRVILGLETLGSSGMRHEHGPQPEP